MNDIAHAIKRGVVSSMAPGWSAAVALLEDGVAVAQTAVAWSSTVKRPNAMDERLDSTLEP